MIANHSHVDRRTTIRSHALCRRQSNTSCLTTPATMPLVVISALPSFTTGLTVCGIVCFVLTRISEDEKGFLWWRFPTDALVVRPSSTARTNYISINNTSQHHDNEEMKDEKKRLEQMTSAGTNSNLIPMFRLSYS